MANKLLFVYGTLLISDNEFAVYLQKNSSLHSKGKFRGLLYDIGNYPGAVEVNDALSFVYGSIVSLNSDSVLKHIDPYEGFGEGQSEPYLYIRKLIDVQTETSIVKCWVYLYNLPLSSYRLIESGDYLQYKRI